MLKNDAAYKASDDNFNKVVSQIKKKEAKKWGTSISWLEGSDDFELKMQLFIQSFNFL